jgi:hypothetical protein
LVCEEEARRVGGIGIYTRPGLAVPQDRSRGPPWARIRACVHTQLPAGTHDDGILALQVHKQAGDIGRVQEVDDGRPDRNKAAFQHCRQLMRATCRPNSRPRGAPRLSDEQFLKGLLLDLERVDQLLLDEAHADVLLPSCGLATALFRHGRVWSPVRIPYMLWCWRSPLLWWCCGRFARHPLKKIIERDAFWPLGGRASLHAVRVGFG